MVNLVCDDRLHPNASPTSVDFLETSYLVCSTPGPYPSPLPDPSTVLEKHTNDRSGVVLFEDLRLVVRFGPASEVKLDEAQAIRAISRTLSTDQIPVPELFGWRTQGDQNFIYMSLIPGHRLDDNWKDLTRDEKWFISLQLGQIIAALRTLSLDLPTRFVGSINNGPVRELYFRDNKPHGPFSSVKTFNDHAQLLSLQWLPLDQRPPDPFRAFLQDVSKITFTHADLHFGNVIISGARGSRKIVGIVDWGQSGWYPECWEYCKLRLFLDEAHEWRREGWLDNMMDCYEDEFYAIGQYWSMRAP